MRLEVRQTEFVQVPVVEVHQDERERKREIAQERRSCGERRVRSGRPGTATMAGLGLALGLAFLPSSSSSPLFPLFVSLKVSS